MLTRPVVRVSVRVSCFLALSATVMCAAEVSAQRQVDSIATPAQSAIEIRDSALIFRPYWFGASQVQVGQNGPSFSLGWTGTRLLNKVSAVPTARENARTGRIYQTLGTVVLIGTIIQTVGVARNGFGICPSGAPCSFLGSPPRLAEAALVGALGGATAWNLFSAGGREFRLAVRHYNAALVP